MATELAGDTICLIVEDDDDAIVLERSQCQVTRTGGQVAYTSGREQVAAVTEADRRRMAAACAL